MAYYRFYPRQPEFNSYPQGDVLADAILAGLSQGMGEFGQRFGPHHRSAPGQGRFWGGYPCGGAEARRARSHQAPQGQTPTGHTTQTPKDNPRKPHYNTPEAFAWWLLGGGGDSSDSEDETQQNSAARSARPGCRGRPCNVEESCAMKRKPSRSASNAPPSKKKDEVKPSGEKTSEKFNFTGKKSTEKVEVEAKKKTQTKSKAKTTTGNTEPKFVFVKRAPWRHVVKLDSELGPEDVRVYVRDGRIRVEGRKERNIGSDDDVIECLEVNRELAVPDDVILDDLSVYFRSGGHLELQAPRKIQVTRDSPELVKDLEKMSVVDIEKDALNTETETQQQDEDKESDENEGQSEEKTNSVENIEGKDEEEKSEDWEMVTEEKEEDIVDNEDTESTVANDDVEVEEHLEDAAKEDPQEKQDKKQDNVKISEIQEVTNPIVEEPYETNNDITITTEQKQHSNSSMATETPQFRNLVVRVVSEEQQQRQTEENTQLLVMNLAGFEPCDVTVEVAPDTTSSQGHRVSVQAVRVQEQDGFVSRRENSRSFRVPSQLQGTNLTCTMGPEGNLVITAPSS